jgi:protein-S-isoprenylcysteine O-methyltransferase Ste14
VVKRPVALDFDRLNSANVILFGVTAAELAFLVAVTPAFDFVDWIYVLQHVIVLAVAFARRRPTAQDHSPGTSAAVVIAYGYPYAQAIYLQKFPGTPVWPEAGTTLVIVAACLSLGTLTVLGRRFGIRPGLRGLVTKGPYRLVRHPMYLSYVLADIGYNLEEWNAGTVLLVLAGWASLIYRIDREERILAHDGRWADYARSVRYRMLPGIW